MNGVDTLVEPRTRSPQGIRIGRNWTNVAYPIGALILAVLVWQAAVAVLHIPRFILPPPSDVFTEIRGNTDIWLTNSVTTGYEIVIGFAVSVVVGVLIAAIVSYSTIANRAVYPLLVISQAVPKVALAPIFVVWFGFGLTSKIVVAFLIAFFPIVVDTAAGISSTPQALTDLARTMNASKKDIFLKIVVPHSLPYVFSGLKVAITLAVSGAIIGEFVGASKGIGYLILLADGNLNTPMLFAGVVVLSVIGVVMFYLVVLAERLLIPWHHNGSSSAPRATL